MEDYEYRISIAQCRKILGKKFETFTDKEIMDIEDWLYKMAKIKLINSKDSINHSELSNLSRVRILVKNIPHPPNQSQNGSY